MDKDNMPFGLMVRYDNQTGETIVSWSYLEGQPIDHFELQVWDDRTRTWVPYDGFHGIVKKA